MKRTLKKIINYAVMISEAEMIILFGSMADGMTNGFSDVDLLIVSENTLMKNDITAKIVSYSSELSLKTDVLIYSGSEIEREIRKPNSFIEAVLKSGKVVYKKFSVPYTFM